VCHGSILVLITQRKSNLGTNSTPHCWAHSQQMVEIKEKLNKVIVIDVTIYFIFNFFNLCVYA
jgi:hypothetical protein